MIKKIIKKILKNKNKKQKIDEYKKLDINIRPNSVLGENTQIGAGTNINGSAFIDSNKKVPVTIGKYCAIAHNLRIRTRNHSTNYLNIQYKFQKRHQFPDLDSTKGPVVIGNNVWIGDNVIILSGVEIGDGAVIGAGSVVTKNIPSFHIAAGNPAKVIKQRFYDSIIEQLIEVKWWDWSYEKIERNRYLFEIDLNQNPDLDLHAIIQK